MKACLPLLLLWTVFLFSGCESKSEAVRQPTADETRPLFASTETLTPETSASLQDMVDRLQHLQSEQSPDGLQLEPLFADMDLENLPPEEQQELKKIVIDSIRTWEKWSLKKHPVRDDPIEEKQIFEALRRKEFDVDPRIAKSDIDQIIACLEKHPPLDPRILSLKFVDENTISIMTGEIRGPLDGGGSYYMARREEGQWVIRPTGMWIS